MIRIHYKLSDNLRLGAPARSVVVLAIDIVGIAVILPRRAVDVLFEERTDELLSLFLQREG